MRLHSVTCCDINPTRQDEFRRKPSMFPCVCGVRLFPSSFPKTGSTGVGPGGGAAVLHLLGRGLAGGGALGVGPFPGGADAMAVLVLRPPIVLCVCVQTARGCIRHHRCTKILSNERSRPCCLALHHRQTALHGGASACVCACVWHGCWLVIASRPRPCKRMTFSNCTISSPAAAVGAMPCPWPSRPTYLPALFVSVYLIQNRLLA
ncbi:hypothetical protein F4780DRAFT_250418 [Xylariomycetidae sp. FL0641]|nr:hypothetical protein F4780DRAFT_250418 [Xylariomycetidae sp. FL0641]